MIFLKSWICFVNVIHFIGDNSGMVGLVDVKRKGSPLIGYWVKFVICYLTHDLDLGFSSSNFKIAPHQEIYLWLMCET